MNGAVIRHPQKDAMIASLIIFTTGFEFLLEITEDFEKKPTAARKILE